MDISLEGMTIVWAILGIVAVVVGVIFFLRSRLKSASEHAITTGSGKKHGTTFAARNKYPEVNPFNMSNSIWLFGLSASLLVILMAFSWTRYEQEIYIPEGALDFEDEIEIEPPRTAEPPPPPPPPPPPVIEEVPEEEIEEEEQPVFEDQSIDEETEIEEEPVVEEEAPPPPPPPPPPPEPKVEEIFKIVEQRPRFPGCEDEGGDNAAKEACATKKMLEFLYKNIKYPSIAKENGIEGTAVIQFVVDKDGSISDPRIVRDVSGGCGTEALRVVQMMNSMSQKWTPGKQRGRSVRVQYNLPVKFKLE